MKAIEADDPMELVGVVLPGNTETMRDMAYAFAEEFARMGYRGSQIETLFKTPFYAGAYRAYLALGEAEIQAIIGECVAAWGGIVSRDRDSCSSEETSTRYEHEHDFRGGDGDEHEPRARTRF